jgi:hypothetical protein
MSANSPSPYDDTGVSRNDYKRHRWVAKAAATALGHQMRPFIIYVKPGQNDRLFASDCRRCGALLIDDWGRGSVEGPALLSSCGG